MRPIYLILVGLFMWGTGYFTAYQYLKTPTLKMAATPKLKLRDYQIDLHMDTVWIYDHDRLVGRFTNTTWNSQYDSIIMKDNE